MAITLNDATEAEIRLALNGLPQGFWDVWCSNSFRRITATTDSGGNGVDGGVLCGVVHGDGHPDLSMNEDQLISLCLIVNRLRLELGREDEKAGRA